MEGCKTSRHEKLAFVPRLQSHLYNVKHVLTNLQLAGAPDGKNPAEIFPEANATGAMILLEVWFMSQHTGA